MDPVQFGEATAPKPARNASSIADAGGTPTPEVTPPAGPEPVVGPPPKHFNWHWHRWVLVAVAVIILSLVAGYIAYRPQFLGQFQTQPTPPPQNVQKTPTPTPDPTANWKTYVHPSFTFKYPSSWFSEENPEYPGGDNVGFFSTVSQPDFGSGDHAGNELFYFEFTQDTTSVEDLKKNFYPNATITTFLNKPALQTSTYPFLIKPSNTTKLFLSFITQDSKNYADQILSTFKFTDSNDVTANWKMFNGNNFSFKYPSDWRVEPPSTSSENIETIGLRISPNAVFETAAKSIDVTNTIRSQFNPQEQKIKVGSFDALRFDYTPSFSKPITVIIVKGSGAVQNYVITFNGDRDAGNITDELISNILSTFKFQ